jgi:hypothetical protein
MSENHTDCRHFEAWLDNGAPDVESPTWAFHLEECAACRQQWVAHQMLAATFAEVTVPELSPAFEAGLQRKIDTAIEIQPLKGWRLAAMLGYALIAAGLLRWAFGRFPLPSVTIDPSSPWTLVIALLAVPLTLWLAIGVTRWLPPMGRKSSPRLGLL